VCYSERVPEDFIAGAPTKTCEDCARDFSTRRPSQARYCRFCRIHRDLQHYGTRQETCMACDAKFCPIRAGDRLCGDCRILGEGRSSVVGKCAGCATERATLLHRDIRACGKCARDPKQRAALLKVVQKKFKVFPEYYDLGRIIAAADERRLGTYRNKSDGLRFHVKRFDPDGTAHGTREFKHSDSDANWIVSARALTTRYEREPDPATAISLLMDLDDAVPRRRIVFLETQLKLAREEIRQLKHKPRCKFSSTCEHGHPDDIANHKNGETW
jgi:hypothetical protein